MGFNITEMIILTILKPHWIGSNRDNDPADQCVHGQVEFRINDTTFVKPEDGDLSLATAALYLMRTIEKDHTLGKSVSSDDPKYPYLFPDEAFTVWVIDGKLTIMGGQDGVDMEVVHRGENIAIRRVDGKEELVTRGEWVAAVYSFADQIRAFYDSEKPKTINEDKLEREGWETFWKEWIQRRSQVALPE